MVLKRVIGLFGGILILVACSSTDGITLGDALATSRAANRTTSTSIPLPTPTPTPNPDSDNDGLTDIQEQVLGTNPYQKDSDVDGLDDASEVRMSSDPLFPDTGRDGIVDGYDTDPLNDLAVELTFLGFIDHTQRGIITLHDGINAYVMPSVDEQPINVPVSYSKPVAFNVPDTLSKVTVSIRVYETEGEVEKLALQLLSWVSSIFGLFQPLHELYDFSSTQAEQRSAGT